MGWRQGRVCAGGECGGTRGTGGGDGGRPAAMWRGAARTGRADRQPVVAAAPARGRGGGAVGGGGEAGGRAARAIDAVDGACQGRAGFILTLRCVAPDAASDGGSSLSRGSSRRRATG